MNNKSVTIAVLRKGLRTSALALVLAGLLPACASEVSTSAPVAEATPEAALADGIAWTVVEIDADVIVDAHDSASWVKWINEQLGATEQEDGPALKLADVGPVALRINGNITIEPGARLEVPDSLHLEARRVTLKPGSVLQVDGEVWMYGDALSSEGTVDTSRAPAMSAPAAATGLYNINNSGMPGQPGADGSNGSHGADAECRPFTSDPAMPGQPGQIGQTGGDGNNAGAIVAVFNNLLSGTFLAIGGNGGNGGDGGNGGPGGDGCCGGIGKIRDGANGGNAGPGGAAGDAGNGGNITLTYCNIVVPNAITTDASPGQPGIGGQAGLPGLGGAPGNCSKSTPGNTGSTATNGADSTVQGNAGVVVILHDPNACT